MSCHAVTLATLDAILTADFSDFDAKVAANAEAVETAKRLEAELSKAQVEQEFAGLVSVEKILTGFDL